MGHHNNNERANVRVVVGWPTVVQAHVKLPTLGKHQRLSAGGGVRKPFHEAANSTLASGFGQVWFPPTKLSQKFKRAGQPRGEWVMTHACVPIWASPVWLWMLLNM
jgi:hypothetical protein